MLGLIGLHSDFDGLTHISCHKDQNLNNSLIILAARSVALVSEATGLSDAIVSSGTLTPDISLVGPHSRLSSQLDFIEIHCVQL